MTPNLDNTLELLRLQVEWGADEAIDSEPVDRLSPVKPGSAQPRSAPTPAAPALRSVPVLTPRTAGQVSEPPKGTVGERALALARQTTTLNELRIALAGFDGCALRDTASNLVFAEGNPDSTTLIIGEPPGREEDRSGHPFAGPEGSFLDQMLASIGLTRADLMLTALLPWRPPGGRPPSAAEITICLPFLHRLIALLKPDRVVLFGGTTARILLPQAQARRRIPPGWVELSMPETAQTRPALALAGVAELIKNPPLRRSAWTGLRMLRRAIDQHPT